MAVTDGATGIFMAIEICFSRSLRQRCIGHRMRNLSAKVPEDHWPEFRERAQAAYLAPSRAIARDLAKGVAADYGTVFPSAVVRFEDDFEACIAQLLIPVNHRRVVHTTNLLRRLFLEEHRRLKIIPDAWGEKAVLKMMFRAMIRALEKWKLDKVAHFELRRMEALRQELDEEYERRLNLLRVEKREHPFQKYPAILGLDQFAQRIGSRHEV